MATFISVLVAMVFSVVFLAAFPTINTLIRSIPMPVDLLPIAKVEVVLLPYLLCGVVFFVAIMIVKNKVQS
jgi:hypothetical protein